MLAARPALAGGKTDYAGAAEVLIRDHGWAFPPPWLRARLWDWHRVAAGTNKNKKPVASQVDEVVANQPCAMPRGTSALLQLTAHFVELRGLDDLWWADVKTHFPHSPEPPVVPVQSYCHGASKEAQKAFRVEHQALWRKTSPEYALEEPESPVVRRVLRAFWGVRPQPEDQGEQSQCGLSQVSPVGGSVGDVRAEREKRKSKLNKKLLAASAVGTRNLGDFFGGKASGQSPASPVAAVADGDLFPPSQRTVGDYTVPGLDLADRPELPPVPRCFQKDDVRREDLPFSALTRDEDVQWWKDRCKNGERGVRAVCGFPSPILEELYVKYGKPLDFSREHFLWFCGSQLKMDVPYDACPMVFQCEESARSFSRRMEYMAEQIAACVDDIRLEDLYDEFNHVPHFPHWTTFSVDSVPVAACCGQTADAMYQPKYEGTVMKLTVMRNHLGHIVCWAGPEPGSRNDGRLWSESIPWKHLKSQEYGLADGAYSGRAKLVAPLRRKDHAELSETAAAYNKVHSFYRARIEHLFGLLWMFSLVRDSYRGRAEGGDNRFFNRIKVLLNFVQFMLRRLLKYKPYGPWSHFPDASESLVEKSDALDVDSGSDDGKSEDAAPTPKPKPAAPKPAKPAAPKPAASTERPVLPSQVERDANVDPNMSERCRGCRMMDGESVVGEWWCECDGSACADGPWWHVRCTEPTVLDRYPLDWIKANPTSPIQYTCGFCRTFGDPKAKKRKVDL